MRFILTVWSLLGSFRRTFLVLAASLSLYEALKVSIPYLTRAFVDTHASSNGQAIDALHNIILATTVALLVISVLDLAIDRLAGTFLFGKDRESNLTGLTKALRLPMPYHEREHVGTTTARIDRGVDKLNELLHDVSWQTIPMCCSVICSTVAMAWVDVGIAATFAVTVLPICWLSYRQQVRIYPWRSERYACYEESWAIFTESVWNVRVIQSFAQEQVILDRYRRIRDRVVELGLAQVREETRYGLARSMIGVAGQIAMLAIATWRAYVGLLTVGDIVFFVTFGQIAYKSLFNGLHLFQRVADAYEGIDRFATFLAEAPSITDAGAPVRHALGGEVRFERVGFSYPDAPSPALVDVSFAIARGTTVAITGPSGSGKSTIVQLILRHHDATAGSVSIDGHDVRVLDRHTFRSQVGYVPQEGSVFSGTIAENIRLGKQDATDAELVEAARLAGIDLFLAQLPNGYATLVGEQGITLSGGQRQRLCIARALVRKPALLIFDEATSALDRETERVVQESLERLQGTTTIVVIAHRLSTIRHADCILVLDHGRLVEHGSHDALIARGGRYAQLVALPAVDASPQVTRLPSPMPTVHRHTVDEDRLIVDAQTVR